VMWSALVLTKKKRKKSDINLYKLISGAWKTLCSIQSNVFIISII